ncbi:MAG: 2-keto-4-pentenoate hydratase/2-oxohepta-3-ene-1,7-dioic acid hydratase in catechol pathway [Candidatus Promineifilaceae bacterium]|jgi:2-keto-4-pentenoate hydratase/2-oxohepta-3-ene-1,7-dioic acid hydratase in catechol pathway
MKIARYIDSNGDIHFSADGSRVAGDIFGDFEVTGEVADVAQVLSPVAPAVILCIGLNYRQHAAETGKPVPEFPILFMKGPNAVQHPGAPIVLPEFLRSETVDYEGELAVVIGKRCKNVCAENALDYVLGYTCANDVSARDWQIQKGGGQWCRGKTFDTFAPLGPCVVTTDEIQDPNNLHIQTRINGELLQDANTNDMIFNVPSLIAFLSGSTTLLPGTVILTGTPHGVGVAADPPRWLVSGDEVRIRIEGIGELVNPVVAESFHNTAIP